MSRKANDAIREFVKLQKQMIANKKTRDATLNARLKAMNNKTKKLNANMKMNMPNKFKALKKNMDDDLKALRNKHNEEDVQNYLKELELEYKNIHQRFDTPLPLNKRRQTIKNYKLPVKIDTPELSEGMFDTPPNKRKQTIQNYKLPVEVETPELSEGMFDTPSPTKRGGIKGKNVRQKKVKGSI